MVGVRRATWSVGCAVLAVVALLVVGAPLDTARVAGAATTVLDRPVVASADDAEETSTGSVSLTSTDLELVNDGTDQTVGLRFTALAVPPGSPIVAAWVQFEVDEATTDATTLQVRAQAADDAAPFVKATANLSARPRTAASVPWVPAPWPKTQVAGVDQRTPSLVAPIQEVVNRPGWRSGNAIAVLVTGTGRRTAEAFDGTRAPVLHLEVGPVGPPVNEAPVVGAGPDRVVTQPASAVLGGTVTDDGLPVGAPVTASWSQVSGPGTATFADANAPTTSVSFDAIGRYVLRLAASDTELGASDDVTVDVIPDAAPVAALRITPSSGPVPLPVVADASASTDADGTPIAGYTFDFADGSPPVTQLAPSAPHAYTNVGQYAPTVTVTDTAGNASTIAASVVVSAAPPPGSCLTQTPLTVLSGAQTRRFKPSVTGRLAVDARTASWTQVDAWPVSTSGTGSLCFLGGAIVGTYPASTSWDTFHHTAGISLTNPGSVIDGLRVDNYGDAVNLRSGADDWRLQGVHTSLIHDDCVQDDSLYRGVVTDSLFDGCYSGVSTNPSSSDTTSDGRANTLTIERTLLRLQPMPTVYKGTAPGHAGFFKWNDAGRSPKLSLHDNVFRVDQKPNHGTLGLPTGYDVSCSGNTIVWLGTGAFPGAASWLAKCPDTRIVTTRATWDDAVAIWTAAH